ncbi:MAG: DUF4382 domain-containing protein [Candidatus Parvarchaeota archaeon]|nr:DUF4382 domain-containing protein [Candidatus Parvarchaeota archaeon]MCL5420346.1 DUF4382 domain-containing protein [Candidatus Parvarchaeota archaeon]
MKSASAAVLIIVIVAAIILFFAYNLTKTPAGNVLLSLTDPANVPFGTQSLNITYSNLAVHTISANGSGWTNLSTAGSVNLLSLQNSSLTLGSFLASNGTRINIVKFNVSVASIEINNTIYPVTLPSRQIIAGINGSETVNGTTRVLLDLSPTVITIVTANSTIFIMVPSVRAVIIPHSVNVERTPGVKIPLQKQDKDKLEDVAFNISITSASLSSIGNVTNLQVTVKDNSNTSVSLKHVMLFGNQSINLPKYNITNVREGFGGENKIRNTSGILPSDLNANISNQTHNGSAVNETEIEKEIIDIGKNIAGMRMITLQVSPNGSLFLPYLRCSQRAAGADDNEQGPTPLKSLCPAFVNYSSFEKGYVLNPGNSVTLAFSGSLVMGEGNYQINIVSNDSYMVVVQGDNGARANTSVTAG